LRSVGFARRPLAPPSCRHTKVRARSRGGSRTWACSGLLRGEGEGSALRQIGFAHGTERPKSTPLVTSAIRLKSDLASTSGECPLLALSGHPEALNQCPLLGDMGLTLHNVRF